MSVSILISHILSCFTCLSYYIDEDEIWSRISAKRKEILGQSSLRLRSLLPRYQYKVRFDLPGLPSPVRTGPDTENKNETSQEKTKEVVKSTDQLLRERTDSLERFLKERRTRLRSARRGTKISSGLVNSADYSIQRSKVGLQRAREVRCGKLNTTTASYYTGDMHGHSQENPKNEIIVRCEECQRLLRERDKFWGLESDSEEEDIKEFNKHITRRNMRRDSRTFVPAERKVVGVGEIAGSGTWTTSTYVRPWEVNEINRNRSLDPSVLQEGHPGRKQGIKRNVFECFLLGKQLLFTLVNSHLSTIDGKNY